MKPKESIWRFIPAYSLFELALNNLSVFLILVIGVVNVIVKYW
jgi:hypothetical protein